MRYFDHEEEYFNRLARLALDLSQLGVALAVQWPRRNEPYISIPRARGHLQVRAALRGEHWVFTWGQRRGRWAGAFDAEVVTRVWEAVQ